MAILKVEMVVARYFDSVCSFIAIEVRFSKFAARAERKISEAPPVSNPNIGEIRREKAIRLPVTRIDFVFPKKRLMNGVNWDDKAETRKITDQRMLIRMAS